MNRHKRLLLLAALALVNISQAQKTEYGFFLGPQLSTVNYEIRGKDMSTNGKAGLHAGVLVRIPFEGALYFTPSLSYSMKGYSVTLTDTSSNPGVDAVSNDIRIHSMELSPLFTVYLGSSPARPFVQFGPSIDVAFAGHERVGLNTGATVSRSMKFGGDAYGRITAGLAFRFGYEMTNGIFFNAHMNYGLGSRNNNDFGPSIKERIFGLSIGRIFKR